jgi:ribosomal protein L37E
MEYIRYLINKKRRIIKMMIIIRIILLILFGLCIWAIFPTIRKENKEIKSELGSQPITCPTCGSTSITVQKQRFKLPLENVSRGNFLPDGINENKSHRVCMKCGKKF